MNLNKLQKIKIIGGFIVAVLVVNVAIMGYRLSTKPKNFEVVLQKEYGKEDGTKYFNSINDSICDYIVQYGYTTASYNLGAPVVSESDIDIVCTLDDQTQLQVTYDIDKDYCDINEVAKE